jgi:DnaJ family protein B protein 11
MVTRQLGPGMFQQYTQQVCEDCPNVKYQRETEFLRIHVEPGMVHGQQINQFEEGEPLIDGEPGDLIVSILHLVDPSLTRSYPLVTASGHQQPAFNHRMLCPTPLFEYRSSS